MTAAPSRAHISPPMLSLLTALLLAAAPLQDTAHVVLVATTDVHGHATDWDYVHDRPFAGGIARVATVVDSLRARYPGQVVAGRRGRPAAGRPVRHLLRPGGAARAASHHRGDEPGRLRRGHAGQPRLRLGRAVPARAVADARFPYVSANICGLPGDTLLYPAYRVVQRQGVRIAITGLHHARHDGLGRRPAGAGSVRVAPIDRGGRPRRFEAMRREADVVGGAGALRARRPRLVRYGRRRRRERRRLAGRAARPARTWSWWATRTASCATR